MRSSWTTCERLADLSNKLKNYIAIQQNIKLKSNSQVKIMGNERSDLCLKS